MSDSSPIFDKLVHEYAERGTRYADLVKPFPKTNPWLDSFKSAPIIEEIDPHTIQPLHARVLPVPASVVEQVMQYLPEHEDEVLVRPFVKVEGQPRGSVVSSNEAKIAVRQSFFEESCEDGTSLFQPVYYLPPFDGQVFSARSNESNDWIAESKVEEEWRTFDGQVFSAPSTKGIKQVVEAEQTTDYSALIQKYMSDTIAKFRSEHPNGIITGFSESKVEEDGSYTITVEGMEIADPETAKRFTPRPHKSVATRPGEFEAGGIIFMDNEYQDAVNVMASYSPLSEGDSKE